MDRAAWRATVHEVTKSQTWLSTHTHPQACTFPLSIKDNLEYHYVHKVFIHLLRHNLSLVQFSSSAMSDSFWPMDYSSMPGLPVHHQLLEYTQTHVHWVTDAIQPSHPLSSPSPPAFNLSQHQGLLKWISSSPQVAKLLEFQLQHQSFQRIFRIDFLKNGLVGSLCSPRDSQKSSPTPQFKRIYSLALSFIYSPTLTSIHDCWKNHSFD